MPRVEKKAKPKRTIVQRIRQFLHEGNDPQPKRTGYRSQPIAPAAKPVLAATFLLCAVLMLFAARIKPDIVAVFACVAVLGVCTVILDVHGRRRARTHPHPLLRSDRLPSDGSLAMKGLLVSSALAFLMMFEGLTMRPGRNVSPWPFFMVAAFLFLVMPQIIAYRALRQYEKKRGKK